jgi:hypothetical protein
MAPPPNEKIVAAVESLRGDAHTWRSGGEELQVAAQIAGTLVLEAFHFSYLGDQVGLTDIYRRVQDKMTRLFEEGATNFGNVANALDSAADGYEQDERNAVHAMRGVW